MSKMVEAMLSNRHVHLLPEHVAKLFGEEYTLTVYRELGEGEFAANETLTLEGPKGKLEGVRILGPVRRYSQVELLRSDCFKLGLDVPVGDSGQLEDAAPIRVVGPKGVVELEHGAIIARRHIHMYRPVAEKWGIQNEKFVSVRVAGERGLTFHNVLLRLQDIDSTVFHLDTEEGNAAGLTNKDMVEII